jgi:hypothetical protein
MSADTLRQSIITLLRDVIPPSEFPLDVTRLLTDLMRQGHARGDVLSALAGLQRDGLIWHVRRPGLGAILPTPRLTYKPGIPKDATPPAKPLNDTQRAIIKLVRRKALKGLAIANKLGMNHDYIRTVLAGMVEDHHLEKVEDGYRAVRR